MRELQLVKRLLKENNIKYENIVEGFTKFPYFSRDFYIVVNSEYDEFFYISLKAYNKKELDKTRKYNGYNEIIKNSIEGYRKNDYKKFLTKLVNNELKEFEESYLTNPVQRYYLDDKKAKIKELEKKYNILITDYYDLEVHF